MSGFAVLRAALAACALAGRWLARQMAQVESEDNEQDGYRNVEGIWRRVR